MGSLIGRTMLLRVPSSTPDRDPSIQRSSCSTHSINGPLWLLPFLPRLLCASLLPSPSSDPRRTTTREGFAGEAIKLREVGDKRDRRCMLKRGFICLRSSPTASSMTTAAATTRTYRSPTRASSPADSTSASRTVGITW